MYNTCVDIHKYMYIYVHIYIYRYIYMSTFSDFVRGTNIASVITIDMSSLKFIALPQVVPPPIPHHPSHLLPFRSPFASAH